MESVSVKPTYAELETEVLRLREELANLRRLIFGQKRERFVPAANAAPQLQMGLGDDRQVAPPKIEAEAITYTRQKATAAPKKLPSRKRFPSICAVKKSSSNPPKTLAAGRKSAPTLPKNWNISRASCM